MSLRDDAAQERAQAVRETERVLAAVAALRDALEAKTPAKTIMPQLVEIKHGAWLGLVGAVSRCLSLEAAAEAVEASDAHDAEEQARFVASIRRWQATYGSRVWDGKAAAAGAD